MDVSEVVDRTIAWALSRSKPNEEGNMYVPNKGTEMGKNKSDERRKKLDERGFVPSSRLDDVLNRPLKKRDHSSRVIGVGSGVAIKEAFRTAERKGIREAAVEIERRVRQKLRAELKEELREELRVEMTSRMNVLFQEKFSTLAKQAGLPNQMEVETNSMIAPDVPSSCKSRVATANSLATLEEIPKEQSPKRNEIASGAKSRKFGSGHNRKGFLKAARLIPTMR